MDQPIQEYDEYRSYKAFFDGAFGPLNPKQYEVEDKCRKELDWTQLDFDCIYGLGNRGTSRTLPKRYLAKAMAQNGLLDPAARPKREIKDPSPGGIHIVDSRLLSESHLRSPHMAHALREAMLFGNNEVLQGYSTLGASFQDEKSSSISPALRRAIVHIVGKNVTAIKNLTPDSGAYVNDASYQEKDWKNTFWGTNYPKLAATKQKWDPDHLFFVTPGINADHFMSDGGRLCRVWPSGTVNNPSGQAPAGDNRNMALTPPQDSSWDTAAWPLDQNAADANSDLHSSKMASISEMSVRFKDWQTRRSSRSAERSYPATTAAIPTPRMPGFGPKMPGWSPALPTGSPTFTTVPPG